MIDLFAQYLATRAGLDPLAAGPWLGILLRILIVVTIFLPAGSLLAMFAIWWERKVAGHIQGRLGPMHVGFHGIAQSLADGIKLLLKEDLIPEGADRLLFRIAPYLAFAPVFAAFMALPFSPQFIFESGLNIGVLYILAVLSVEVMGVILAGCASNSKWAVYGAMREACQIVSYEIPLAVSILCGVLVAGTLDLVELSYLQGGGVHKWFVFHNPFIFVAFVIYFIASLAANKRAPFDLPESESELVAGFHTEYSGLRWAYFFFAEYDAMFVVGGIQTALFLGGWNSPLGKWDPVNLFVLGYDPVLAGQNYFAGAVGAAKSVDGIASAMGVSVVGLVLLNLYGAFWFLFKMLSLVFVQMWIRWTLPRIRIDQVLYACVKVLLPASLIAFVGVAGWVWLVPQPASVTVNHLELARLGHLASPTPWLQWVAQVALALVGAGVVLFFVGVAALAWLKQGKNPPKSLFAGVMPVGRTVAFNPGDGGPAEPMPR
ncbi:MAG: NADH-quinone oxidoreductase subunit NuoH [Planctomycetota bacterium]|nr:NADH-quinone oxidoreductase subunit NuoH [Planctomycetota bacterium]